MAHCMWTVYVPVVEGSTYHSDHCLERQPGRSARRQHNSSLSTWISWSHLDISGVPLPLPMSVETLGGLGTQLRAHGATADGGCPGFSLLVLETQITSHTMPYDVDDSSPGSSSPSLSQVVSLGPRSRPPHGTVAASESRWRGLWV